MEDRVARLEANVEHIQKDVSEMKTDIRRLNDKVDAVDHKLTAKIDGVEEKLTAKIDRVEEKLTAKIDGVEKSLGALWTARAFDRVWYLLMTAGILGIMARAFKWI